MFGTSEAVNAAKQLLSLRKDYSNPPKRERQLDPLFYAYLKGHQTKVKVSRQIPVPFANRKNPSRIDYRIGGSNPTLIELAVRPPDGAQELMGPQNLKELRKLSKFPQTEAKRRILLLVDLKDMPLDKAKLEASYDRQNAGPGRKNRCTVTIVYVHADLHYSFPWNPFK